MHLTIPTLQIPQVDEGSSGSPVSLDGMDVASFQHAVSGFGMEFGPPLHSEHQTRAGPSHLRQNSSPSIISQQSDVPTAGDIRLLDVALTESDTAPIASNAVPIAGTLHVPGSGPPQRPTISATMLGDDLARMESGLSRSASSRRAGSPVTASPLQRGASMLRQMSQRIVNVSNEQDVVERTIHRRNASVTEREQSPNRRIGTGEEMEMEMRPLPLGAVSPGIVTPTTTPGLERDDPPPDYLGIYPRDRRPSLSADDDAAAQASEPLQRHPSPIRGRRWRDNPFKGYALCIFSPDLRLRMRLCDFLIWPWTEHIILGLIIFQTIILAIDTNRAIPYNDPEAVRFGKTWIDYVLLGLFIIYTVEIIAKIIVSGLILNDAEYSTIDRSLGWARAILEKIKGSFGEAHQLERLPEPIDEKKFVDEDDIDNSLPPLLHSLTVHHEDIRGDSFASQRLRLARRAFLRHSFNRLDFISVVAFWVSFILQFFNIESGRHVYVFRMLSCLRIMRLLRLTSGTSVILRSLKKAAPLLLNVGFLIGFFWLIFAIIGVQSFKSSLRRQCVWQDPINASNNWTNSLQFCGGYLNNTTYEPMPWLKLDGSPGASSAKGFYCPVQSVCQEVSNPYSGSVSYDNVLQSAELVFVLMTTNTFTDLMYYTTNSDYLAAALFSAIGVVILYFWLVNLLIAVITSTFQVIREGSKSSPFTGEREILVEKELEDPNPMAKRRRKRFKTIFKKTQLFWLAAIAYGLVVMCMRSATMGLARANYIDVSEKVVTFLLLVEIVLRAGVDVIDRRNFFRSKANVVDLAIAIITTIMQIPRIHDSGMPYDWLTFFQILRIYRLVMAVPMTRNLIVSTNNLAFSTSSFSFFSLTSLPPF
jgi:voltage-dependent calcium channel